MKYVWGKQKCIQHFGGKKRGRRPLRRRRSKWEGTLKYNLKELNVMSRSFLIWFRQICVAGYYKPVMDIWRNS